MGSNPPHHRVIRIVPPPLHPPDPHPPLHSRSHSTLSSVPTHDHAFVVSLSHPPEATRPTVASVSHHSRLLTRERFPPAADPISSAVSASDLTARRDPVPHRPSPPPRSPPTYLHLHPPVSHPTSPRVPTQPSVRRTPTPFSASPTHLSSVPIHPSPRLPRHHPLLRSHPPSPRSPTTLSSRLPPTTPSPSSPTHPSPRNLADHPCSPSSLGL
nr:extensin-like [Salvelinus alpinus]